MKEFRKLTPKKKFGQNFIEDKFLLSELVDLMEIKKNDIFVEIGPGTGNLTKLIVDKSASCTSIEIDRNFSIFYFLVKHFHNIVNCGGISFYSCPVSINLLTCRQ